MLYLFAVIKDIKQDKKKNMSDLLQNSDNICHRYDVIYFTSIYYYT